MYERNLTFKQNMANFHIQMFCMYSEYPPATVDSWTDWEGIVLCEETVDFIYSRHTPLTVNYEKGSRSFLEEQIATIVSESMTDREKVLAVLRWLANIAQSKWGRKGALEPFRGGTEEEVIQKGGGQCTEMSRVHAIMTQIMNFPSRLCVHVPPHTVTEVYIDGKWSYMDPLHGIYYVNEKEEILSFWELIQNPQVIYHQPDYVFETLETLNVEKTKEEAIELSEWMFLPAITQGILNYFVADFHRYSYDHGQLLTEEQRKHNEQMQAKIMERINKRCGGDGWYKAVSKPEKKKVER